MKPTAYVLFVIGLALAVASVLVYRNASPFASAGAAAHGDPGGPSALTVVLLVAAAGAMVGGWALLRYGGTGYTETVSPPRR
jgi:hypothetical protein